ncbi:MAG: hypothetical protein COA96_08985 [SAR86 cluster bacterium]|uniref:Peptidase n=1 Tax=SAR86 cluster bacterium TaxID=2030880 RepID=A0A2A5B0N6_9GAMM|nr:MAG: hypothetical protein COA96_08985 [SAR86 cluster bacterium]
MGDITYSATDTPSATSANRNKWFNWHAWLGFKLSILMFIICLTGTLATVSNEIDWLVNPMLRVQSMEEPINWQAMYDNFQQQYPEDTMVFLESPLYSNFASIGLVRTSEGTLRRVFFNPYSGEINGDLPWAASVQRMLRDLHRFLLFPVSFGAYLVSFFGVVLFASLVSALFVYKKWWRGFFKLRLNRGRRILFGDLHRVMGLWSLWFLLIISLTGTWYLVERVARATGNGFGSPVPMVEVDPESSTIDNEFVSVDVAVAAAKAVIPRLKVHYLNLPVRRTSRIQPYVISGQSDAFMVRPNANRVYINPLNGEVLEYVDVRDATISRRLMDSVDPLHFGNFAGIGFKLLYLIFGLITLAMTLTGIWMWLKRNKKRQEKNLAYKNMGWWKQTSIAIAVIGLSWGSYTIFSAMSLF